METLAQKIITFNKNLVFEGRLPPGVEVMNPFLESSEALDISSRFYQKFYNDRHKRHIIFGINPGRLGAGVTGVPFTDTKRLSTECGLAFTGPATHETSSVFVYDVINAYGGTEKFYRRFYIQSVCPLGFTITNSKGKKVNYNYYDNRALMESAYDFILLNIRRQIQIGMRTDVCFLFGTGKNETFFRKVNAEHGFFKKIVALEHPRFIMQYKARSKQQYIDKYLAAFSSVH